MQITRKRQNIILKSVLPSITHVITGIGLGPKITFSTLAAEQQRRKAMSLTIGMEALVDYEISRDILISCLMFHLAVVVEYHVAGL